MEWGTVRPCWSGRSAVSPSCYRPAVTSADHVLDPIRNNPDVSNVLEGAFDFDISRGDHGEEIRLSSGAPLEGFAGDAAVGRTSCAANPAADSPWCMPAPRGRSA